MKSKDGFTKCAVVLIHCDNPIVSGANSKDGMFFKFCRVNLGHVNALFVQYVRLKFIIRPSVQRPYIDLPTLIKCVRFSQLQLYKIFC